MSSQNEQIILPHKVLLFNHVNSTQYSQVPNKRTSMFNFLAWIYPPGMGLLQMVHLLIFSQARPDCS